MPHSHHSHSGQFCGHATNTLQEVVEDAISKGMTTFCLTEHIHRERIDFYPKEEHHHSPESLEQLYDDFYLEARKLQNAYADRIQLFVGFEGEWIRESSLTIIQGLLEKYKLDLFVGSVHHVHTFPIDYDTPMYHQAREVAGGSDEMVFSDYFDAQYAMLQALHPPVVGHFDLIRLKSDDANRSFKTWPNVWDKAVRNLKFIAEYGGVLELNSSSLRKGMREAYPQVDICAEFKAMGGRFALSDDSHGIDHVGLNYGTVLDCVKAAGIEDLYFLAPGGTEYLSKSLRDISSGKGECRNDILRGQRCHAVFYDLTGYNLGAVDFRRLVARAKLSTLNLPQGGTPSGFIRAYAAIYIQEKHLHMQGGRIQPVAVIRRGRVRQGIAACAVWFPMKATVANRAWNRTVKQDATSVSDLRGDGAILELQSLAIGAFLNIAEAVKYLYSRYCMMVSRSAKESIVQSQRFGAVWAMPPTEHASRQ